MKKKFPLLEEAAHFLSNSHPKLSGLIAKVGPPEVHFHAKREVFEALATAIIYQQLHGKAAETILNRFVALYPKRKGFPEPRSILRHDVEKLMTAGLSRAKANAILDLARKAVEGKIPSRKEAAKLSNEELVLALTEVKGIGRWTVEMFLMFTLGRADILPVHDFGVRKGYMLAFGKRTMPSPKQLEKIGRRWSPHRTVASWYFWRACDAAKEKT
jgi:DNA-3-methyladenine glycosylase II